MCPFHFLALFFIFKLLVRVNADVTLDLVKGVLEGKLQPVYDALLQKGNASFVITSSYLQANDLPLPWTTFKAAPLLHFSMGGDSEAYFRISSMLLAAKASPDNFSTAYPPAILFALGYGRSEHNEDMATSLHGILENEKFSSKFHIESSLKAYHTAMNYSHSPTLLEYTVSAKFIHGLYALLSGTNNKNLNVNAFNNHGMSVLHYAAYYGYSTYVDLLITHPKINFFIADTYGRTALHLAILRGHLSVLKSILDNSEITRTIRKKLLLTMDQNKHTILDIALISPIQLDIVKYLLPWYELNYIPIPKLPPSVDVLRLVTSSDEYEEDDDESDGTGVAEGSNTDIITNVQSFAEIRQVSSDLTTQLGWVCTSEITPLETNDTDTSTTTNKHTTSTTEYTTLHQIDTIHSSNITKALFNQKYLNNQRPVLITGNLSAAERVWKHIQREKFVEYFKDLKLESTSASSDDLTRTTLSDWLAKMQKDNKYTATNEHKVGVMFGIAESVRGDRATERKLQTALGLHEVFSACKGEDEDKNDIQVLIGAYSSGESTHAHGNSIDTLLVGRRKVLLLSPGALGPRDYAWTIPNHVLLQYEQLMGFRESGAVYEVYMQPGDTLYIPAGWVHASINMCDTVSISREFCSGIVNEMAGIKVPYDVYSQVYGRMEEKKSDVFHLNIEL